MEKMIFDFEVYVFLRIINLNIIYMFIFISYIFVYCMLDFMDKALGMVYIM